MIRWSWKANEERMKGYRAHWTGEKNWGKHSFSCCNLVLSQNSQVCTLRTCLLMQVWKCLRAFSASFTLSFGLSYAHPAKRKRPPPHDFSLCLHCCNWHITLLTGLHWNWSSWTLLRLIPSQLPTSPPSAPSNHWAAFCLYGHLPVLEIPIKGIRERVISWTDFLHFV